jgi:hypothetical protein
MFRSACEPGYRASWAARAPRDSPPPPITDKTKEREFIVNQRTDVSGSEGQGTKGAGGDTAVDALRVNNIQSSFSEKARGEGMYRGC